MTEMQSDFEDWLKKFNGGSLTSMPAAIEYVAWQAWQASRAAVVVKLLDAEGWTDSGAYSFSVDLRDVQHSLSSNGVSYE